LAHDRVDGNEFKLTHEFLAVMLGVRRSGITTALQELERKGLITHRPLSDHHRRPRGSGGELK